MTISKKWLAAAGAPVLIAGVVLGGAANASQLPAAATHDGVAGYEAASTSTDFTNFSDYIGLGNPQYGLSEPEQFVTPALVTQLGTATAGSWTPLTGAALTIASDPAARIDLSNTATLATDQLYVVPVAESMEPGGRTWSYDVVAVAGTLAPVAGDHGDAALSDTLAGGAFDVIARNVPATRTAELSVLYDGAGRNGHYTVDGIGSEPAGSATFVLLNDATGTVAASANTSGSGVASTPGTERYVADADLTGVRNSVTSDASLASIAPVADTTANIGVRMAHLHLDGNNTGGSESRTEAFQSGLNWAVTPVAAVDPANLALPFGVVTVFASDHFSVVVAGGAA